MTDYAALREFAGSGPWQGARYEAIADDDGVSAGYCDSHRVPKMPPGRCDGHGNGDGNGDGNGNGYGDGNGDGHGNGYGNGHGGSDE